MHVSVKLEILPVFLLLNMLLVFPEDGMAYFDDAAAGVRPAGMGEAFVSVADDANTLLYNPAGLANIECLQLTGMYSDLYSQLNAKVYTGQNDRMGYTYSALAIPLSEEIGCLGTAWTHFNSLFYKENQVAVSYGREILAEGGLNFGISGKWLQFLIEGNDYSTDPSVYPFSTREKNGFTADLGLLASPVAGVNLGAGVENIVPVNMGFTTVQNVPVNYRAGMAYKLEFENLACNSWQTSVEWSSRDPYQNIKCGTELWMLQNHLGLRAGINLDEFTAGFSFSINRLGSPLNLQFDYAFAYPFNVDKNIGSHRVGMTFSWDNSAAAETRQPANNPDLQKQYFQEGITAFENGDNEEAIAWFEEILSSDPANADAKKYLEQAKTRWAKDKQLKRSHPPADARVAIVRKESKLAVDPALIRLEEIRSTEIEELPALPVDDLIRKHLQAAENFRKKNDLLLAMAEVENILAWVPDQAEAGQKLKELRAELLRKIPQLYAEGTRSFKARKYSQAQRCFQQILQCQPGHSSARYYYVALQRLLNREIRKKYDSAVRWMEQGQYAEALDYFRQIWQIAPNYRETGRYLGMARTEMKGLMKTRIQFKLARQRLQDGELNQALAILSPLLEAQPVADGVFRLYQNIQQIKENASRCYQQGIRHFRENNFALAAVQLKKCRELDKDNDAGDLLQQVYCTQGVQAYRDDRLEEALQAWAKALELDPENQMVKKYLKRAENKARFFREHGIK